MPDIRQPIASSLSELEEIAERFKSSPFYQTLARALDSRGMTVENVCDVNNAVARRLLAEYGAVFLATERALVPPSLVFRGETEVTAFQSSTQPQAEMFGADVIELQPAAMTALVAAREEAMAAGFDITPRGGAEAGRRGYADTLRLWASRFLPALEYWTVQEQLSFAEAKCLRGLAPQEQLVEVLKLEERGLFFSKDFSKSILYSVAAPGASQHLSLLAFDVAEFREPRVRAILAQHGWHQTVLSDLPHFTFLGFREKELPRLGLRRAVLKATPQQTFWIPNLC